ncbi:hypothetical protein AAG906_029787 [Vitis piasezkii]
MQSHQLHNLLEVVHSLDQEIGPSDNASDPNVKPFSLRQYVHATRERDISLNWPFPERYLKTCLKYGIINVLPPLESHDPTKDQSLRKDVGLSCSQEEKATDVSVQNNVTSINKDLSCSQVEEGNVVSTQNTVMNTSEDKINKASCNLYFDESVAGVSREVCQSLSNSRFKCGEDNQLSPDTVLEPVVVGIQSSTTAPSLHSQDGHSTEALTSPKMFRHKQRKRKRKLKKRSMVEICAVAKHRTLEDLEKSYRLGCDSLTEDCSEKKYQSNHDAAADEMLSSKRKREVKFKFSRCKPKSWDKKFKLSKVADIKVFPVQSAAKPETLI